MLAGNLHHLDLTKYYALLDLEQFWGLGGINIDIDLSTALIHPILMLSQIHCYKGLTVELKPRKLVIVGADIPPYHVITVKL